MKVNVKIVTMLNSAKVLEELRATKFSAAISFKVKKITDECGAVQELFDKRRIELLDKHATLEVKSNEYKFPAKNKKPLEEFNAAIQVELESEVELEIPLLTLEDLKDFPIDANSLSFVDWFVENPYVTAEKQEAFEA